MKNKLIIKNKFVKSGIGYTIGNFALKGIGFITVPIFTSILSTDDYGKVNTFYAWLSILTIVVGMNLYSSIRNAFIDFKNDVNNYISDITTLSIIILSVLELVINIVMILSGFNIKNIIIVNLLVLQSFATFIITVVNTKYTFEYKYMGFLFNSYFSTILNVFVSIFLILTIFKDQRYLGRVIGGGIPTILLALYLISDIYRKGSLRINKNIWKYALIISVPLIPHTISQFILSQSDRILISKFCGDSYTGIYGFTYNISLLLTVLWTSLDSVWTPWFTEKMRDKKYNEIRKISNIYVIFFTFISVILLMISPEIIKLLSRNKEYWKGISMIAPILLSGFFIFLYSLPVNVEYYYKKTKIISIGTIFAAIFNIIGNLIFLPKYGYQVAAYTTLLSYILLLVFHWIIMRKICKIKLFNLKLIVICSVFILICGTVFTILINYLIIRLILFFIFVIGGSIISIKLYNLIHNKG